VEVKTPTKEERIQKHVRSIKISFVPAVMGVIAGFLSSGYILGSTYQPFSIVILALAIYAQKYILPLWGVDTKKFAAKDWFYVGFMTFAFWYVSWTIIVNGMPLDPTTNLPKPQFGPIF
jgi:hypothetical protein